MTKHQKMKRDEKLGRLLISAAVLSTAPTTEGVTKVVSRFFYL